MWDSAGSETKWKSPAQPMGETSGKDTRGEVKTRRREIGERVGGEEGGL